MSMLARMLTVLRTDEARQKAREYIERRTIPIPHAGCRLWLLSTFTRNGYGAACFRGVLISAHVLAFHAWGGTMPNDATLLRHKCDNKWCCEPSHLIPGDEYLNADDACKLFRMRKKLTSEEVREIRSIYGEGGLVTQRDLATQYGVCQRTIQQVVTGNTWLYA